MRKYLAEAELVRNDLDVLEVLRVGEQAIYAGGCVKDKNKYSTFTVLTCSSRVASSSTTSIGCGCSWRPERVHMWFTPPSMHF